MSRLALLVIWLACAYADDDCVCNDHTPEEENEIWNFLKQYPDGTDHEGVLAGVLSPLVPCGNCIESDRKKRTILPSTADQEADDSNVIDHESSQEDDELLQDAKRTFLPSAADQEAVNSNVIDHESPEEDEELPQDARCPVGFARIGFRCIPFDDIYK